MELIFNPCGEFQCEVRRAQLAKSIVLTTTMVPLGSFQIFKVSSDAKESGVRKATGSYCNYSIPGAYGGRLA